LEKGKAAKAQTKEIENNSAKAENDSNEEG